MVTVPDSVAASLTLETVRQSLGQRFAACFDPVLPLAASLPAYSGTILEMHPDRPDAWFDLAFKATLEYDRPLAEQLLLPAGTPAAIRGVYRQLAGQAGSGFRFGIENLWFEYDFPFHSPPAIFFDLYRGSESCMPQKQEALREIMQRLQLTFPASLEGILNCLQRYQQSMVYAGFMFSRKTGAVRITIPDQQPETIGSTLSNLGWEGDRALLQEVQQRYLRPGQRIALAADVGDRLSPRIGIEVSSPDLSFLLSRLEAEGRFPPEKAAFMKAWPGTIALSAPTSASLAKLHQRNIHHIYRRINHVKFILDGAQLYCKAYLYYCF